MGEQHSENTAPNLYPTIAPGSRFAAVASTILNKIGQPDPRMENAFLARWTTDDDSTYVLRSYQTYMMGGFMAIPNLNFMLEQYVDKSSGNQPLARYHVVVSSAQQATTHIRCYDAAGRERSPDAESQTEINQKVLAVLTDADPDAAESTLRGIFEGRLQRLAGSYVLSDLAVEGNDGEEIDDIAVLYATQDFEKRTRAIEKEELKRAKRRRAKRYPQPAYYEAVEEAVNTRHYATKSNKYADVDILAGAAIVAHELDKKWPHSVASDQ